MSMHVDKISVSVSLQESGLNLRPTSFELYLAVNSFPYILIDILPVEANGGDVKSTSASTPSFDDITKLYNELTTLSIGMKTHGDVSISVESSDAQEAEKTQSISLSGWILSDVGMSSVTSYSAPVVTITLSHPARILDSVGTIYEDVKTEGKPYRDALEKMADAAGGDTVSLLDSVFGAFAGEAYGIRYWPLASPIDGGSKDKANGVVKQMRQKIADNLPGQYLEGDGSGIFLQKILSQGSSLVKKLKIALAENLAPSAFGTSIWGTIVQFVLPYTLQTIVPRYDKDKLLMEPNSPWQSLSYTIDSTMVQAIDMTSRDPNPIKGVAIAKHIWEPPTVINNSVRLQYNPKSSGTYSFYFPESASVDTDGGVGLVRESPIISQMKNMCHSGQAKVNESSGDTGSSTFDGRVYSEACDAYAKAMFLLDYRSRCTATATTILMFNDTSGNAIYPGRVMTIQDPTGQGATGSAEPFYGYITKMVARGEVGDRPTASSQFWMAYARPAGGAGTLVEGEVLNPCYSSD